MIWDCFKIKKYKTFSYNGSNNLNAVEDFMEIGAIANEEQMLHFPSNF